MNRLTVNKPVEEMGMYELAHNSCFAKNGEAYYRDYDREISARDFARELYKAYSVYEPSEDDYELDEALMDDLVFGPTELHAGLIALFYRNLWAMADLYERLKFYEDYDEQNLLVAQETKTYEDGLADAWKLAKDINNLNWNDIKHIFGDGARSTRDVMDMYTTQDVVEMFRSAAREMYRKDEKR